MKKRIILMSVTALLMAAILSGCGTFGFNDDEKGPQYVCYQFPEDEPVKQLSKIGNKNNPNEVIDFARSLSKAGRYKEAAHIYLDAAERFKSKNGSFGIDCRMAAVKEFWFAGDLKSARDELTALERDQDIYSYSGEADAIRKLRKLLNDTAETRNKLLKTKQEV